MKKKIVKITTETTMTEMGLYEQYIAKSRYARYLDEKGRRENWDETVRRYVSFMQEKTGKTIPDHIWMDIELKILNREIMPSMRALMTAGAALERDNTCGYNCAYLSVDDPKAFDEAMFILLCGTGVGFSVEKQYISKLPEVPTTLYSSETTIVVHDSKEGWSKALRQLLALLWSGEIPKWDLKKIRPAGARLKTFGGRASGPEPLNDLFKFVVKTFQKAEGRRLTSLECHDILCKIGEVVVVGGVRRSAMISLSDLDDDSMRHCKTGSWWMDNPQRSLANNSAVYDGRPDMGRFLREWTSLYESGSGERGIFNRKASIDKVKENGRRNPDYEFGTNPCSEIILRPNQFCNLTEVVVRPNDTFEMLQEKVRLATILGTAQATLTTFPYLRKVWTKNTEEERLLGVSLTGIFDNITIVNSEILKALKEEAIATNKEYANAFGIPAAAAITCVKPSGTVSQLVDSSSGIHPRFAPYYIRRVRSDNKDPLTDFMKGQGIPWEPDLSQPATTTIFSFPMKSPDEAFTRRDLVAYAHFNVWKVFAEHWCEHKPSVTFMIKEDEWLDMAACVYDNFNIISGISFLPYDGGSYKQAPYEEITEEQYNELQAKMPAKINWEEFIENTDNVEGAQQYACVSGFCEI